MPDRDSHHASAGFHAHAITRTGLLEFDAPLETVFPLFTANGERVWAKGWDPTILYPLDCDVTEGQVFQTRDDGDRLLTWTMTRYDEANHAAEYNVVTPDYLVRQIRISCLPSGASGTSVEVTDSYIGLSPEGNGFVDQLTEAKYADKMANWKEWIGGYLAGIAKQAQ